MSANNQRMKKVSIIIGLCCALGITAQNKVFTVGGYTIEMVPVQGGVFYMGAQNTDPNKPNYDPQAADNEGPVHKVQVSDFWISTTCVSQGFWEAVTGLAPHNDGCITPTHCQTWYAPYVDDTQYAAYYLTYTDVQKFLSVLNSHSEIKQQITFDYREGFYAPTEAQWEYAARGGENAAYHIYAGSDNYNDVAWTSDNCSTIPKMKQKQPNALGLYDMCGSLAEWCKDKFGSYDSYNRYQHADSILIDPENSVGNYYVQRGGRYPRPAVHNRIATRYYADKDARSEYQGLRLVMRAPIPTQTTDVASVALAPSLTQAGGVLTLTNIVTPEELTIYSMDGKVVYSTRITTDRNQTDISHLASGMYVLTCGTLRRLILL